MNTTPNEIQNILLEAMSIIANNAVQEGTSDQDVTLWTCIITDDSKKNIGEYKVTDGNVSFVAYSANTDYKVDDHVAVVIPQGSFENNKYIVQKVAADGIYLPYATPLDNYIKMGENLTKYKSDGAATVDTTTGKITPISLNKSDLEKQILVIPIEDSFNGQTNEKKAIFDSLTLECGFQSAMPTGTSGNYGIKLEITFTNILGTSTSEILKFDSSEFMGNPYDFIESTIQKKAFALTAGEALTSIIVTLYQNLITTASDEIPLVTLNDFNLHFGNDISRTEDDTVEIYTIDNLSYYGDKDQTATENTKRVGLLWHNKTGENKYIGFSDGRFDTSYSEQDYLNLKETEGRIEAERNKTNGPTKPSGLQLAVDLTKIEEYSKILYKEIDKLMSTAEAMGRQLNKALKEIEISDSDPKTAKDFLERISDKTQSAEEGYLAYWYDNLYKNIEEFLVKYREKVASTEEVSTTATPEAIKILFNQLDSYLTLDSDFVDFYVIGSDVRDVIQTTYGGFFSLYDSYNLQIQKYRNKIFTEIEKIKNIFDPPEDQSSFDERYASRNTETENYESTFNEEDYANKYCIYWYKYSEGKEDNLGGTNWEKISEFDNHGIPVEQGELIDGIRYNKAIDLASINTVKDYNANPLCSIQELKAILFFNHQQYNSNVLKFIRTTTDGTTVDNNGILTIVHKTNSQDVYQLYDETYNIINSLDSRKERLLEPAFSGYMGQSLNDFTGGQIYWYLPKTSTMLKYKEDSEIITIYGISSDTEETDVEAPQQKAGYYCFTKTITDEEGVVNPEDLRFSYQIADYYSNSYKNNTIYCKLVKGAWEYEAAITLLFSSYGSSGTDYTLSILPAVGGATAVTKTGHLTLDLKLFDYTNTQIPFYNDTEVHEDQIYGFNPIISWAGPTTAYKPEEAALIDDEDTIAPNNYPVITTSGLGLQCTITSPYATEGTERYWCDILKVQVTVRAKNNGNGNGMRLVGYYCVPYSIPSNATGKDYISGATSIIYSSLGTEPKYYKDPYKLYNDVGDELEATWEVLNQNSSGYPQINEDNKIVPQSSYIPEELYITEKKFPIAHAVYALEEEGAQWYQPIYIAQDKYEFSALNDFDGSTAINAEEGVITTTMFIAGSKNSENQFSGIMMGDLQNTSAGSDFIKTGIFGFDAGAAAFGFRSDGTAFIGKSGSGKIEFNGNKGTITSVGYEEGSGILLDLDGPEFSVKKDGIEVMGIKYLLDDTDANINNKFFLQTKDFSDPIPDDEEPVAGQGFKIDLEEGYIKAYNGLTIHTTDFELTANDGNNYIKPDGIKWGSFFEVNDESFRIGSSTGTNISGNNDDISFNFTDGNSLVFSSSAGLTCGETVNINSSSQILRSAVFNEGYTEEDGTIVPATGMEINLQDGTIKAYSGLLIKADENNYISLSDGKIQIMAQDFNLNAESQSAFVSFIEYKDNALIIQDGNGVDLNLENVSYDEDLDKLSFMFNNKNGYVFGMKDKNGKYEFVYDSQIITSGQASEQKFEEYRATGNYHVSQEFEWESIPLSFTCNMQTEAESKEVIVTTTLKLNSFDIQNLISQTTIDNDHCDINFYIKNNDEETQWITVNIPFTIPATIQFYSALADEITITTNESIGSGLYRTYTCHPTQSFSSIKTSFSGIRAWNASVPSNNTQLILSSNSPLCPLQLGNDIKFYWNGAASLSSLIIGNSSSQSAGKSDISFQIYEDDVIIQSPFTLKKLGEFEIQSKSYAPENANNYVTGIAFSMEQCVIENLLVAEDIYVGKQGGGLYVSSIYPRTAIGTLKLQSGNGRSKIIVENDQVRFINNRNANIVRINSADGNTYFRVNNSNQGTTDISVQWLYDSINALNSSTTPVETFSKETRTVNWQPLDMNGDVASGSSPSQVEINGYSLSDTIFVGKIITSNTDNGAGTDNQDIFIIKTDTENNTTTYYGIIEWMVKGFTRNKPWI